MNKEEIIAAEQRLLQFLFNGAVSAPLREEIVAGLRGYAFRRVEHQVLFDCLQAMPSDRPELIRELLPARLVRAGFPDFDLAPFLFPSGAPSGASPEELDGLSAQQARMLVEQLTGTISSRSTGD